MTEFDPNVDYYEILQVHPKAHQEVIKRAYRTIVGLLQAHPDLGGTHEDAVRVNNAYEVLSNPEVRKSYDAARRQRAMAAATRAKSAATSPPPRAAAPTATASAHTQRANTRTAYQQRQSPRANTVSMQTVHCPYCGAHNRLPQAIRLEVAICGKCHARLSSANNPAGQPTIQINDLKLSRTLVERLLTTSELRLTRSQVPENGQLRCTRCHFTWLEVAANHPPAACPRCRSTRWSDFRLFSCAHCHHRFITENLFTWPYWLFPECPSCHRAHWHEQCERHPLRWWLNKIGI